MKKMLITSAFTLASLAVPQLANATNIDQNGASFDIPIPRPGQKTVPLDIPIPRPGQKTVPLLRGK